MINAITYISRSISATKKNQPGKFSENQLKDLERQLAYQFAKKNNLWIDLSSLPQPIGGGGNENSLYYDEKSGTIYKSNNLFNHKSSILSYLNYILTHNQLFKTTSYEFVGFTGYSSQFGNIKAAIPYVEPVVFQKFIVGENATENEIQKHMEGCGFEKINKQTYQNENYIVSDLKPRNVLKDKYGKIYLIDNLIDKKNPDIAMKNSGEVKSGNLDNSSEDTDLEGRLNTRKNETKDEKTIKRILKTQYPTYQEALAQQKRNNPDSFRNTE